MTNHHNRRVKDAKKSFMAAETWIKKIPWLLARHAFVVLLFLILCDVFVGEYMLYQYAILPRTQSSQDQVSPVVFKENIWQAVSARRDAASQRVKGFDPSLVPNPF